mgnify:FL=1|tara:strand:- start:1495 stop:1728 length:234 start_codon:yes stop_codon:yes gene_type:complete
MGKMKELAMEEQERQCLESLYDAQYWEVQDAEYDKQRLLMLNIASEEEEQYFMKLYTKQDTEVSLSRLELPILPTRN